MTFIEDGLVLYTILGRAPEGTWYKIGRAVAHAPGGALAMARANLADHPTAGWVHQIDLQDDLAVEPASLGPGIDWETPFPYPPTWEPGG